MLKKHIEGSNVTILNSIYIRPRKNDKGKWSKGSMNIVYRDLNTMEKHLETIDDPDIEYYMLNEGETAAKKALFIEKEKVSPVTCKYRQIEKDIAQRTDNLNFFQENIYNGNRALNKRLHSDCVNVFRSDMNIEDYYRFKFNNMYKNNSYSPTKAYFDIEVDGINQVGDFPTPQDSPINAITYIDVEHMTIFTLLLKTKGNKLIDEFYSYMEEGNGYNELKSFIISRVGGEKNAIKYKLDSINYKMLYYDDEINLISDFFKIVNKSKPDFIMAWNMRFDLPFIYERILMLGYDPLEIMCNKDFKDKHYMYYVDPDEQKKATEQGDYCTMSSYSVWIDQMRQFAARRKAKAGSYKKWALDYIGEVTTGIGKLDYSSITRYIAKLPYLDYKTFVFYNIMDTIVQYCVEFKVQDVEYIFNKCLINNTRYAKCHNQTIYLVNRANKEFYLKDLIIGNNKNKFNPKPTEKYPGAHVADPRKINPYAKYKINNIPILAFNNLDDYDYKAMYPSILNEFNIAPNTQIGRIYIDKQVFKNEDPYNTEHFSRSGKFIEDLHSHNYIEFSVRWFNLANYIDLCKDVQYYYTKIQNSTYRPKKTYDGNRVMLHYENSENKTKHMIKYPNSKPKLIRYYNIPESCIESRNSIDVNKIVFREDII